MEEGKIRRDKITPYFVEGFVKWWERNGYGQLSRMREKSEPCLRNIDHSYASKLESRITTSYSEFLNEYPHYRVDPVTFWFAYIYHPVHWEPDSRNENVIMRNYREKSFEEISSCIDKGSNL